jgi:hypothetical protein
MAPRGWIKWEHTPAREVILFDLIEGVLPMTEEEFPAQDAWDVYRHFEEFRNVVFSQFQERLKGHRQQVTKKKLQSSKEEDAFLRHMQLHPAPTHNTRGQLLWNYHPAMPLLQEDVKERKHVGVIPSQFQKTRPEYLAFKPLIFKQRIYQEIRRQKFIFYLNLVRAQKLKDQRARAAKARAKARAPQN